MSGNSTTGSGLPPSLDLPPHLSAQKYFFVCTLTVAAWDTLVLSPRGYRLWKTEGWPALKILFNFLRILMPIEFTIVGVAFFDTSFTLSQCNHFFLFEPITTAILLAAVSAVHVIRIHAIYDQDRLVRMVMGALYAMQIVVTAICCGFYKVTPLLEGQGCIAMPKHTWVGIYWLPSTLLTLTSFGLATARTIHSRSQKPLSPWKLMLRDGLNLYGTVALVQLINFVFWFAMPISKGEDRNRDPVKTLVTSMTAVLSVTMTLRIILGVRGTLANGGSFAPSASHGTGSHTVSGTGSGTNNSARAPATFTLDSMQARSVPPPNTKEAVTDWDSVPEGKVPGLGETEEEPGVKITIDTAVDYK